MKLFKAVLLTLFLVPLGAQNQSLPGYSLETHLKVMGLTKAGPPEFWNGKIIFTYAVPSLRLRTLTLEPSAYDAEKNTWSTKGLSLLPGQKVRFLPPNGGVSPLPLPLDPKKVYFITNLTGETFQLSEWTGGEALVFPLPPRQAFSMEVLENHSPRYAALAFAHENFLERRVFYRNAQDVYFSVYDPASDRGLQGAGTLEYRFILDGLWTTDPSNPSKRRNTQGVLVSTLTLPQRPGALMDSPVVTGQGTVEFHLKDAPGRRVSVIGNFNNWDPFMHPLREDPSRPGTYSLTLKLPEGRIFYAFMIGAEKINDPLNPKTAAYDDGETCSWVDNRLAPPLAFRGL